MIKLNYSESEMLLLKKGILVFIFLILVLLLCFKATADASYEQGSMLFRYSKACI